MNAQTAADDLALTDATTLAEIILKPNQRQLSASDWQDLVQRYRHSALMISRPIIKFDFQPWDYSSNDAAREAVREWAHRNGIEKYTMVERELGGEWVEVK